MIKEVAYVNAGSVIRRYQSFCEERRIGFHRNTSLKPCDTTTLFVSAGMQHFKPQFRDENHVGTVANVQSCLRLNDLDEIDDGTHFLYFNMLGLFSFRQMTMREAIHFWLDFLDRLGLPIDWVTIHPDRLAEWAPIYREQDIIVLADPGCTWSDGEIAGYCTEFFKNGVEIGNIVNPLGTCIDAGFGVERLDMLVNRTPKPRPVQVLIETIQQLIESGYVPGNKEQGYVLRRLLRNLRRRGAVMEHPFFEHEVERHRRSHERYMALKERHADKPPEWWFDTHGIDVREIEG